MHLRIDTDARTPAERITAAELLRAAAELLEAGGSTPPADAAPSVPRDTARDPGPPERTAATPDSAD